MLTPRLRACLVLRASLIGSRTFREVQFVTVVTCRFGFVTASWLSPRDLVVENAMTSNLKERAHVAPISSFFAKPVHYFLRSIYKRRWCRRTRGENEFPHRRLVNGFFLLIYL